MGTDHAAATVAAGTKPNCPTPVRLYREDGGRRLLLPCRRRVCSVCGPAYWRPRVLAGLHAGLGGDGAAYLALLLTAPGDADPWDFNETASARWHHFITLLRRSYRGELEYWRVAELQDRGHIHFHVVIRGQSFMRVCRRPPGARRQWWLATGRCCGDRRCVRRLALQAGFGGYVGLRRPRDYPGGVRSVGWYFGKYLLKQYGRVMGGVVKLVTASQGWRTTWVKRERPEGGLRWIWAGPVGAGWRVVGHFVPVAPERPGPRSAPGERPLTRREREAESVPVWDGYVGV